MADIEKVKQGLRCCVQGFDCPEDCQYINDCNDLAKPMFVDLAEDAMSVIEEQQAEIERLQPRWIPISERLPETGERVLVLDSFLPSFDIMRVDYRNSERQKTFACSHRATYWMPLPNPPQKDGDGE